MKYIFMGNTMLMMDLSCLQGCYMMNNHRLTPLSFYRLFLVIILVYRLSTPCLELNKYAQFTLINPRAQKEYFRIYLLSFTDPILLHVVQTLFVKHLFPKHDYFLYLYKFKQTILSVSSLKKKNTITTLYLKLCYLLYGQINRPYILMNTL